MHFSTSPQPQTINPKSPELFLHFCKKDDFNSRPNMQNRLRNDEEPQELEGFVPLCLDAKNRCLFRQNYPPGWESASPQLGPPPRLFLDSREKSDSYSSHPAIKRPNDQTI